MSFFDKLFGFFRKKNTPTPSSSIVNDEEPDAWQPIQRDYSQIHVPYRAATPPVPTSTSVYVPVPPTIPPARQALPHPMPTRPAPKQATVVAPKRIPPPPMASPKAAAPKPTNCPHGRRRREFCPICDPEGYKYNFGDWTTD